MLKINMSRKRWSPFNCTMASIPKLTRLNESLIRNVAAGVRTFTSHWFKGTARINLWIINIALIFRWWIFSRKLTKPQIICSPLLQSRSISCRFSCISSLRRGRGLFILADIVVGYDGYTQNHLLTISQSHHNKQRYKTTNCTKWSADVHCVTNAVVINRYNLPIHR